MRPMRSEPDVYLKEDNSFDPDNFNVLNWWNMNKCKYRILLPHYPRYILTIPISTFILESSFSTSVGIVSRRHSKLRPSIVEALRYAQNWLYTKSEDKVGEGSILS